MAAPFPAVAARSMCGPPGNGNPSTLATLSKASPAASSMVEPSGTTSVATSGTSSSDECPPDTSSAMAGRGQRAVLELVDGHVRGQVVDAVERLAGRERVRLGRAHADQQRAGQARPGRDRDGVDVGEAHARLGQRPVDGRHHGLQMRPAGDLGHDAAESRVLVDAGGNRVGEQLMPAHQAHARLVAGRLDAEDQGCRHDASRSRCWPAGPRSQAHHDRVGTGRLVVGAPDADLGEAAPAIEPLRARVVGPDLQEHLGAAAAAWPRRAAGPAAPSRCPGPSVPSPRRSSARRPARRPPAARRSRRSGRRPRPPGSSGWPAAGRARRPASAATRLPRRTAPAPARARDPGPLSSSAGTRTCVTASPAWACPAPVASGLRR